MSRRRRPWTARPPVGRRSTTIFALAAAMAVAATTSAAQEENAAIKMVLVVDNSGSMRVSDQRSLLNDAIARGGLWAAGQRRVEAWGALMLPIVLGLTLTEVARRDLRVGLHALGRVAEQDVRELVKLCLCRQRVHRVDRDRPVTRVAQAVTVGVLEGDLPDAECLKGRVTVPVRDLGLG